MGEQTDFFRAIREHEAEERMRRRLAAPKILAQHDVGFTSHNGGAHLVVRGWIDFWPGTGRWQARPEVENPNGPVRYGRGIFALLRHLGIETPAKDLDE